MSDLIDDVHGSSAIEVLLVTTKAHHTRDALKPYSKRITRDTLIIFIQNGMGIVDSIRDILSSKRIVVGTTTNAVYRSHPNEAHWVHKGETILAPEASTTISPHESDIISALGQLVPYSTLERRLYRKLALNACINPVTAIFNVSNSIVADASSPAYALSSQLAKEIQQIYTLLRPDVDVSRLAEDVLQLALDTGGNTSSMLADVRAGRETEIDYINGYIVEMGHNAGIEVIPENEMVVKKVRELTGYEFSHRNRVL